VPDAEPAQCGIRGDLLNDVPADVGTKMTLLDGAKKGFEFLGSTLYLKLDSAVGQIFYPA
jgi:hypothetical protein